MWPDSQEVSVLRERVSSLSSAQVTAAFQGRCVAQPAQKGRACASIPTVTGGSQPGGAQVSRSSDAGVLEGQGMG